MYSCAVCILHNIREQCLHSLWCEWLPQAHYTHLYMASLHSSPLCHLLVRLAQSCPMSEAMYLLALAVQSSSISFSLLRKKMGLGYHYPLAAPSLRTQALRSVVLKPLPGDMTREVWKRRGAAFISHPLVSSFFHGYYPLNACNSSPSWERCFFTPVNCLLKYSSSPFPLSINQLH